jgi:hypothetical protein
MLRRAGAGQPAMMGVLYLFDQETREARTEILRGNTQRREIRRRPLSLSEATADEQSGTGIAQVWPGADGPMLRDAEGGEGTPLIHDRLYALAGGAVTLRYRSTNAVLRGR